MAVVAAEIAAATPRLEVYPRGLDAGRAVRLASGALSGVAQLTPAQVAERVAARFPEAAALPDRPELDALLDTAGVPLRWDDEESRYLPRRVEPAGLTSLTRRAHPSRVTTGGTTSRAGWRRVEDRVVEAEDRLARSLDEGGWLVLSTSPRRVARVAAALRAEPVKPLDVERELLTAMRAFADAHGVDWGTVLAADVADRSSTNWTRLMRVVSAALPMLRDAISAAGPAVLLLNAGILARYDPSLSLLDSLREQVTHAGADAPVRTVWLLVPWHDAEAVPRLDDAAVPIFGPQWLALREDWLIRREGRVADGVA